MWFYLFQQLNAIVNITADFIFGQAELKDRKFRSEEAEKLHQKKREHYGERLAPRGVLIVIVALLAPTLILTWLWGAGSYREPSKTDGLPPSLRQQHGDVAPDVPPSTCTLPTPPPGGGTAPGPPPDGTTNLPPSDNPLTRQSQ